MKTPTYNQWKEESKKTIDFSTWTQNDMVELYLERMDQSFPGGIK